MRDEHATVFSEPYGREERRRVDPFQRVYYVGSDQVDDGLVGL